MSTAAMSGIDVKVFSRMAARKAAGWETRRAAATAPPRLRPKTTRRLVSMSLRRQAGE